MKRNVRLKICVTAMAALFMPLALSAQTDGFFSTDNGGGSRDGYPVTVDDDGGAIVHTQQFQGVPKAPLGNGLLIMVAAGAGYLALKRKEDK